IQMRNISLDILLQCLDAPEIFQSKNIRRGFYGDQPETGLPKLETKIVIILDGGIVSGQKSFRGEIDGQVAESRQNRRRNTQHQDNSPPGVTHHFLAQPMKEYF